MKKWKQTLNILEEREYLKALKSEKLKKWKGDLASAKARARNRAKATVHKKKFKVSSIFNKMKTAKKTLQKLDRQLQHTVHGKPKKRRKRRTKRN